MNAGAPANGWPRNALDVGLDVPGHRPANVGVSAGVQPTVPEQPALISRLCCRTHQITRSGFTDESQCWR